MRVLYKGSHVLHKGNVLCVDFGLHLRCLFHECFEQQARFHAKLKFAHQCLLGIKAYFPTVNMGRAKAAAKTAARPSKTDMEADAVKTAAANELRTQQTMFAQVCGSPDATEQQKAAFAEYK